LRLRRNHFFNFDQSYNGTLIPLIVLIFAVFLRILGMGGCVVWVLKYEVGALLRWWG
jgi:hypothetical protein